MTCSHFETQLIFTDESLDIGTVYLYVWETTDPGGEEEERLLVAIYENKYPFEPQISNAFLLTAEDETGYYESSVNRDERFPCEVCIEPVPTYATGDCPERAHYDPEAGSYRVEPPHPPGSIRVWGQDESPIAYLFETTGLSLPIPQPNCTGRLSVANDTLVEFIEIANARLAEPLIVANLTTGFGSGFGTVPYTPAQGNLISGNTVNLTDSDGRRVVVFPTLQVLFSPCTTAFQDTSWGSFGDTRFLKEQNEVNVTGVFPNRISETCGHFSVQFRCQFQYYWAEGPFTLRDEGRVSCLYHYYAYIPQSPPQQSIDQKDIFTLRPARASFLTAFSNYDVGTGRPPELDFSDVECFWNGIPDDLFENQPEEIYAIPTA